ncbi:MAG: Na(+)-translocating NADH-quinone reductase subunit C [Melioribacteraceae bacterium]|nr:Na(+)-translocating NADH-quinone reductase subunit C [Melioribacteraceae bacterium]MCF8355288.1 Na(+)-translocating NADH-quinone reductase subunit C [Melioribacteraceae bacterium]MCF8394134.1 Na(+)-translocating NADH-quinone reductase subunit C [Melioribacteraceae bacterium]MCF8418127.1 Na(+)-translocating NADH-quinone reductase subunit C [Melioribacteraceae bacterium]
MSSDSTKKTIQVALGVCLVCSILVSTAAVSLSSRQAENKQLDKIKNILVAGGIDFTDKNPQQIYEDKIKPVTVELKSGKIINPEEKSSLLQPKNFEIKKVSNIPDLSTGIPASEDIAGIKRKPTHMVIYEVMDSEGNVDKYIFPVHGKGLWSTLYGFISLDNQLKTVEGITFYEHGETPGLGGEVDNPSWKNSWKGKKAFNEDGEYIIDVLKGKVDPSSPKSNHQIDGLSGSTLTTRGVDNLLKYWLGENGYGEFIENVREEGSDEEI